MVIKLLDNQLYQFCYYFILVWFYSISTVVGYIMPRSSYIYIYIYRPQSWSSWKYEDNQYWCHAYEVSATQSWTHLQDRESTPAHDDTVWPSRQGSSQIRGSRTAWKKISWCLSHRLLLMVHYGWETCRLASHLKTCCHLLWKHPQHITGSLAGWVECSPMIREIWVQSQVASYERLQKCYMRPPCLTQQYKVRIKSKVDQFWERSSALLYTST